MATIKQCINNIKSYVESSTFNLRFETDFEEQISNKMTSSEIFPCVFVCPDLTGTAVTIDLEKGTENTSKNLKIFVLDRIQKDRENIIDLISDTEQIATDIIQHINEFSYLSTGLNLEGYSNPTPLNNSQLDYLAGWTFTVSLGSELTTRCDK